MIRALLVFLILAVPGFCKDFETEYFGERIECSAFNQMEHSEVMLSAELEVEFDVCVDSSPLDWVYLTEIGELTSVRFFVGHEFDLWRLEKLAETDDTLYLRTSDTNLSIGDIEYLASVGQVELLIDSVDYNYSDISRLLNSEIGFVRVDTRTSVKLDYPDFVKLRNKAAENGKFFAFLIDVNELGKRLNLNHEDVRRLRKKNVKIVLR